MSYNKQIILDLIKFMKNNCGNSKSKMIELTATEFTLKKDRSVFHNEDFAIRFSYSKKNSTSFSNTVLSIKTLKKYDDKPFIVCLITPDENYLFLANSSCLNKISHSSKRLTIDNLVGSFNGGNILRAVNGLDNNPVNFENLFTAHEKLGFDGNIERLVENTHNIVGRDNPLTLSAKDIQNIEKSIERSNYFMKSNHFTELIEELDNKMKEKSTEIISLSKIDNVNLRGREIENLISNQSEATDELTTSNDLSDYDKVYPDYIVSIDIKSKMVDKNSAPKGFNIDKLLEFLSKENTVYLTYIIGIANNGKIYTRLVPLFDESLLSSTRIVDNWSGINSRGTTQYDGNILKKLVLDNKNIQINTDEAKLFLNTLLSL